ncbi:hypothetical protein H6503_00520 [Candidatus Woesearchaeota archaeon]|nr:hypothetical protein [Candidatus Woesearchaeota archaeon]
MNFTEFVQKLDAWGIADVLLPFILVFTIVFAILQKTEILGKGKKNFNSMIALVFGFAVVFPHVLGLYPDLADPVDMINRALPQVSIVLVAVVALLLIIGILGGEVRWIGTSISGWIAIISLIIIIYIFGRASGWPGFYYATPRWLAWLDDPDVQAFIIIILVFAILIWYITKDEEKTKSNVLTRVTEDIGKLFGGSNK